MGTKVAITRTDHTGAELWALSAKCADGAQVRRMLALALVLDGRSRSEAAVLNGMDRQTLRDWVHRYNEAGIEGLKSRKSPGREPYLTTPQMAELRELVIKGPDPATNTLCSKAAMLPSMNRKLKRNAQTGTSLAGLAISNGRAPLCEGAGSLPPGSREGILSASAPVPATAA